MQKAEKRFQAVLQKYKHSQFKKADYMNLDVNKMRLQNKNLFFLNYKVKVVIFIFVSVTVSVLITQSNLFYKSQCLIDMPSDASKWFREPESCSICDEVKNVPKIENISSYQFYSKYAKPSKPVVVKDGARTWSALSTFSFDFFKNLYTNSAKYNRESRSYCQFFPYKTEFASLNDALNMSLERAHLNPGEEPWYIGWSNCNDEAGNILRKHYETPYFLPNTSENIALNWIFMGGPGQGAHMHVDNVQYPSWQAQLKGKKLWRLAPAPECYYKCQEVSVIVEPGEIIVVDTNRWYHQTFILPGEISITIGSEFD